MDVLKANPGIFEVIAISGHNNIVRLAELARQWQPRWLVLTNKKNYMELLPLLDGFDGEVVCDAKALTELAAEPSISTVVAAVTGIAGLASSYAALAYGKKLLLANKEPLIAAGDLMLEAARKGGGRIIPVDSEHSGAWQCLGCPDIPGNTTPHIERLILTASGGPFRDWSAEDIASATVDQACKHPTWSMGRKISIDSASMMNKGLELIEASKLFSLPMDKLDVIVHRESIVHALAEYSDGSMLAQMSQTSMKVPLAKALGFPDMLSSDTSPLDLAALSQLHFEQPDLNRFPCLSLAMEALKAGGDMPLRLNAANEVAVSLFLEGHIRFGQIAELIDQVLQAADSCAEPEDIESVLARDNEIREWTRHYAGVLY